MPKRLTSFPRDSLVFRIIVVPAWKGEQLPEVVTSFCVGSASSQCVRFVLVRIFLFCLCVDFAV